MKKFIFLLSLFFLFYCKTTQETHKLVYGSNRFAIHKIDLVSEEKNFFIFPKKFGHPVIISNKKIFYLLAELSYFQFTEINSYKQKLFFESEVNEISNILPLLLKELSNKSFLLIIMKVKPNQTVISNYQMTRFLVWHSEGKLNLFFDKIREPIICRKCASEPSYWALPRFNFENKIFGKAFIQETQNISYKSSGTLNNRKWITVDIAKIKEEEITSSKKKTSESEKEPSNIIEKKEEEEEEEIKKLPPVPLPFDEDEPQNEEANDNLTGSTVIIRHEE